MLGTMMTAVGLALLSQAPEISDVSTAARNAARNAPRKPTGRA
jgi:hypothetical protein